MSSTTATTPDLNARFEQDVAPHRAQLYPAAMRMTGNPWDAEDLVQETMVKAYTSLHQLREDSSARAWLRTILANTFVSRYRKQGRELCPGEFPVPAARSAEADALARLPDSELVRAMRRLPADHRLAIYLADVEGYPYGKIAEMTGVSAGAVKSRVWRGRTRLRELMSKREAPDALKRAGRGSPFQAELVAFRVGEHDPARAGRLVRDDLRP